MNSSTIRERLREAQACQRLSPACKLLRLPIRLLRSRLARYTGASQVSAPLICDQSMTVVLPEAVSTTLYCYGFFDPSVCHMMLDCVQPGDAIFDVGSHFGFFSIFASVLAGENGQVHCFEPTPSTFEMLSQNTSALKNVRRNNCAASEHAGEMPLRDFGLKYCAFNTLGDARLEEAPPSRLIDVQVIALDDYCAKNRVFPQFVKIDAENSELQVLHGLQKTLKSSSRIALAIEVSEESFPHVQNFLATFGLTAQVYDSSGRRDDILLRPGHPFIYKDVLFIKSS
jgi:FkbM family methyltransferase